MNTKIISICNVMVDVLHFRNLRKTYIILSNCVRLRLFILRDASNGHDYGNAFRAMCDGVFRPLACSNFANGVLTLHLAMACTVNSIELIIMNPCYCHLCL